MCPTAPVTPFCVSLRPQIYADRATLEFFRRPSPIGDMKQMYRQQYEQADYARLRHSDTKIVGIYDDHDYGEVTSSGALRRQGSGGGGGERDCASREAPSHPRR